MKKYLFGIMTVLAVMAFASSASAQNTNVYLKLGGAEQVIAKGGKMTVQSGGQIEMQVGSTLTVTGIAIGGIAISSAATSSSSLKFMGYTLGVSTHGVNLGEVWLENASGTFTIAICTTTVGENAGGCASGGCWLKK